MEREETSPLVMSLVGPRQAVPLKETCVFPDFHITQDMGRRTSGLLDKPAVTELHFRPPLPGSYKIANPTAY